MTSYPTREAGPRQGGRPSALLVLLSPVFAFLFVAMGLDMLFRRARPRAVALPRAAHLARARVRPPEVPDAAARRPRSASTRGVARALHEADEANLTWAGRRLLKPWYLDELPQIWNVLRGDMSLVGPRPWPPSMVANQVAKGLTYRNEFVAGWTGPAQVQKGVTEPAGYAELDVAYVDAVPDVWRHGRVVRTDLAILWRTVVVMAKGEGLQF